MSKKENPTSNNLNENPEILLLGTSSRNTTVEAQSQRPESLEEKIMNQSQISPPITKKKPGTHVCAYLILRQKQ